jgi:hypothetical protein
MQTLGNLLIRVIVTIACLHTAESNIAVFEAGAKELGFPQGPSRTRPIRIEHHHFAQPAVLPEIARVIFASHPSD